MEDILTVNRTARRGDSKGFRRMSAPDRCALHTAKGAASVDPLSGNGLILGIASGDRPVGFPAFRVDFCKAVVKSLSAARSAETAV